jgi:hypothetical protein
MKFARWVYGIAGAYGVLVLLPLFFVEGKIGRDHPPAITHPEFYYGFVGAALAWQVAFLVIAADPRRFRPLMLASMIEKGVYGIATIVLFAQHRVPALILVFGIMDLSWGMLFVVSYRKTPPQQA